MSRRDYELREQALREAKRRDPIRTGGRTLQLAAQLLPGADRSDWLEEQRACLTDLPDRRARRRWIVSALLGTPRYAYTVRTGRKKEAA
ncbi:hypothetical protein ACFT9I_14480 [Streptomyces sp. NPDC057137]|uniref:hypothetical protein n=1 Tax=Streptomyces sp. NPDC057137 TaxID=3346030 RepID=UPI0036317FA0